MRPGAAPEILRAGPGAQHRLRGRCGTASATFKEIWTYIIFQCCRERIDPRADITDAPAQAARAGHAGRPGASPASGVGLGRAPALAVAVKGESGSCVEDRGEGVLS